MVNKFALFACVALMSEDTSVRLVSRLDTDFIYAHLQITITQSSLYTILKKEEFLCDFVLRFKETFFAYNSVS